jgi:hypothetical protein
MIYKLVRVALSAATLLALVSCATNKKCSDPGVGFNPVYDSSCKVRIRSVYVADSISPELKGRFKENPETEVQWVGTVNDNGTIIPGHFVILNASGKVAK